MDMHLLLMFSDALSALPNQKNSWILGLATQAMSQPGLRPWM